MKRNSVLIILGALAGLNLLAWLAVWELRPQFLEVTFFDVGQGDAAFIETPKGHQILIDGGPDSTVLEKLEKEMPFWDRTIDLIILTHPERDHIAGLLEVLKRYEVENILWTGIIRNTAEYEEWARLIKKEGARIYIAQSGQKISTGNFELRVLNPENNLAGQESKDSNDTSVVALLVFGENSFLFTGDSSKSTEKKLIIRGLNIDSDILKVGHHGSKTSSYKEFIEQVSPEVAVISAGKDNKYGHPHREVLETLEQYGVKILRTDISGDIKIISDGLRYQTK